MKRLGVDVGGTFTDVDAEALHAGIAARAGIPA